jgi:hypothetical protein
MLKKGVLTLFFAGVVFFQAAGLSAAAGLPAWGTPVKVEGMQASRVSAVWYKGKLHIVHGGKDGDAIWHGAWDGNTWMINRVSNLDGQGAPALEVFQGKLHMVYKGGDDTLWHAVSEGANWTPLGRIPGQKSHYSPSVLLFPFDRVTGGAGESLLMFRGGGSKDSKTETWNSWFDGSSWVGNQKVAGAAEGTASLCRHKDRLFRANIYYGGITILPYVSGTGWLQADRFPQLPREARTVTPVSMASDGEDLFVFFRQGRSKEGSEEPIFASVLKGNQWETPVPVRDFTASNNPTVVAVPAQKGKLYLLFTRNKEIWLASSLELKPSLRPLKQMIK